MEINKLTATFGRLENEVLEPGKGLTIINSPNESGKSTWCAFIRAMLYGIDTTERERGGMKPDKVKFAPWSGTPMEGRMELVHNDREITITRRSKGAVPMKDFSAVYTGTSEPVPLNPLTAGEELTGMPKGVFERTVFIRQSGVSVSGNPDLEKRIAAIVSTGDEGSSYTETDEQLRAWQRKRRYNRRGAIPELENQISGLNSDLETIRAIANEAAAVEESIPKLEAQAAELEEQVVQLRKNQRKTTLARMSESREKLHDAEQAADAAKADTASKLNVLRSSPLGEIAPEEAVEKAENDYEKAVQLEHISNFSKSPALSIILAVLAVLALIAGVLFLREVMIAGGVLLIAAAASFISVNKSKQSAENARYEFEDILKDYRVNSSDEILQRANAHVQAYNLWAAAAEAERNHIRELELRRNEQNNLDDRMLSDLDFSSSGSNEAAAASREQSLIRESLIIARESAASSRGRLDAVGDPLVIESQLLAARDRLTELEEQYDALSLAIDVLKDANTEIQNRFSPRIGRRATEFMSRLTGGRYDELTIDRQMAAKARLTGDVSSRESAFLSAGALDQMYFALRLAMCELALSDMACPMILDDALVNFDDERMALALDLLLELSETRQILLFTCHKREAEYLKNDLSVTIIP